MLNQCTIASNTATGSGTQGGAIYASYGSLTLNQCTVAGNSASDGGGIYSQDSLNVSNSIVAGNISGEDHFCLQ